MRKQRIFPTFNLTFSNQSLAYPFFNNGISASLRHLILLPSSATALFLHHLLSASTISSLLSSCILHSAIFLTLCTTFEIRRQASASSHPCSGAKLSLDSTSVWNTRVGDYRYKPELLPEIFRLAESQHTPAAVAAEPASIIRRKVLEAL